MVCWHGDVVPNSRRATVPLVEFGLRECDPAALLQDQLSGGKTFVRADQAVHLGQYRVGTVLYPDGSRQDRLPEYLPWTAFDVDFDHPGGWEWCTAEDLLVEHREALPWLAGAPPRLQMITFKLKGGGALIVPCIELFWRTYGRGKELQRVLLTYRWPQVRERLFGSGQSEDTEGVDVTLGPGMIEKDAVLLAYIRHDRRAQRCARCLFATVEAGWPNAVQPRVAPWFGGPAQLAVRAVQVAPRTYYGVRIEGCSQPQGGKIRAERLRTSIAGEGSADSGVAKGRPAVSLRRRLSGDLAIRPDADPDFAAGFGSAAEDPFVELGPAREYEVLRGRRRDSGGRHARRVQPKEDPAEYSMSEPSATGDGIGLVRVESPTVLESHGVLLDMWNAMQFARREFPERIRSVEWYTVETGYRTDSPPGLMALPSAAGVAGGSGSWVLIDPAAEPGKRRPRGVLVMRVAVDGRRICIVEIERRPVRGQREERFAGLVFEPTHSDELGALLEPVLAGLPSTRGVFRRTLASCPVDARVFHHSHSGRQRVACEAAIANALAKMGIRLGGRREGEGGDFEGTQR